MQQLHLYRKGLASLEALEPHVKKIAEEQHIEYQLNEPEEDDGEVSFEFYPEYDDESTSSENSMEVNCISLFLKIKSSTVNPYSIGLIFIGTCLSCESQP